MFGNRPPGQMKAIFASEADKAKPGGMNMMKNSIRPTMNHAKAEAPNMDKFELDNMASKLMDAHEIMGNPAKMKAVSMHLKKKVKTIKSIQGLRDKRKQLQEEKTEPMDNMKEEMGE